ncbi:hypothetical protein HCN44_001783 [Aphidius gifuensis]|uniref:Uncharacterized protein n=1 Tax=Aphidius gifuensis TaxID=684658 RepID=A0A834XS58_APHGI|nr:hypothetical protein HCN44_001783 [Aphidius gifuensis]
MFGSIQQRISTTFVDGYKPDAIDVYTHYLATRLLTNGITDLLTMQGRSLDAAMTNFNIIVKNTKDEVRLLQKLSKCFKTQFMNLQNCRETQFVIITLNYWSGKLLLKIQNLMKIFSMIHQF